ncbi:AVAST type 2 anti-phage system protein Avs2 [Methylomonas sp. HYX-M1]|uniref:AVAST type 2 anti-phage system protein Avs2 n=1 Tax=Methylomonas sp. HYX-M1 TaxID=3139307 RepID=UPI00345B9C87
MTNTDLLKIRSLNGSQHYGFEELCCQLASLEPRVVGDEFLRKGHGSDAGVECYVRQADGTETGWQAKFFDKFESGQITQLTESFRQAIEKHPKLTRYIVCLPIDLKDGRTGKNKTEGQRWIDWKTTRLSELSEDRNIEIILWQATDIRERLHRNDPFYAGRMCFFFDELRFTPVWFSRHINAASNSLGSRYTPQFHISLPIRQVFLGISRSPWLEEQREYFIKSLIKRCNDFKQKNIPETDLQALLNQSAKLIDLLNQSFPVTKSYPTAEWCSQIQPIQIIVNQCQAHLWHIRSEEKDKSEIDKISSALNDVDTFGQTLEEISEKLSSDTWILANEQAVLLYGEAGTGKSHLLADIANDAIKKGYPAIFLINSQFFLQDPRTQILEQLDLRHISFSTFLGALDAAGQAAGVRALLIIDALNERFGVEIWPQYLALLIEEVKRYPHLALIVSCRTTYLPFVLPADSLLRDSLKQIEHHGFADGGGYAARTYLAKRKIFRPSVPHLLPEFNNPLFLKTLCDSLERQGLNCFPRGIQGLTEYFDFYLKSLANQIELRMGLDKRQNIIARALKAFTAKLLSNQSSYLSIETTIACFDSIYASTGQHDRSLLSQFEHEGILTIEPVYIENNQLEEQARFTFERFSDFQIATHLLNEQLSSNNSVQPLEAGTPLHNFLSRKDVYRVAGIIEALSVLLPETRDCELLDIFPSANGSYKWTINEAFLNSLLLRRQDFFTDRTRELVIDLSQNYRNPWLETLVAVSTEPNNRFNANYLHDKLAPLTMPERDAKWSIAIANLDLENGSPLDTLLSWTVESGFEEIDPIRAELAATMLTWLFSTSYRTVRDRATKGLSALLAPRLPLALSLLERFQQVDDIYILERLLAACYGAALQAQTQKNLAELALFVYQWIFADGKPPAHLLLRDYARGIIEYALHCELLLEQIEIEKVRPPYQSDWPIEFVDEKDLAKYGDKYKDDIVRSASSEWLGDFAKYIIKPSVHHWTVTPLGVDKAITPYENFEAFRSMLADHANSDQLSAFNDILKFCIDCNSSELNSESQKSKSQASDTEVKIEIVAYDNKKLEQRKQNDARFEELEKIFINLLDDKYKYQYWSGCRQGIRQILNRYSNNRPEHFDDILAQRWVTKRAHDYGWTYDLFGEFDGRIGSGRGRRHKQMERIGKKYQWLALYELLARIADNLIYDSGYSDDAGRYEGPWQIYKRNIDPSLLISKTKDDNWENHPHAWWSPQTLKLRLLNKQEQKLWLQNESDQLNSASLLDVTDPDSEQRWLVMKSFKHYSTSYDLDSRIDSWCRCWCLVVKKQHKNQFINAISTHNMIDPDAFPKVGEFYGSFIGEYPWYPSYELDDDWKAIDRDYGFRYKALPTYAEYTAERGGYDYSIEGTINTYLPAPWLIQKLGLRLINGSTLCFADEKGQTLFKDPSVHEEGPTTALIDRTALLDLLDKENLAPVWIIAGEKGAYGEHHDDFVGRRVHSFVYSLNEQNEIVCVNKKIDIEER